jgi:hypothetical protein
VLFSSLFVIGRFELVFLGVFSALLITLIYSINDIFGVGANVIVKPFPETSNPGVIQFNCIVGCDTISYCVVDDPIGDVSERNVFISHDVVGNPKQAFEPTHIGLVPVSVGNTTINFEYARFLVFVRFVFKAN